MKHPYRLPSRFDLCLAGVLLVGVVIYGVVTSDFVDFLRVFE